MNIAFFCDINCNHNQKWLNILAKRHKIILITEESKQNKADRPEYDTAIKIYPILPQTYSVKNLFVKNPVIDKLNSILEEHKIDIVHSIYAIPYSLWADDVKNKKHIVTTYGSDMLIDYINWNNPQNLRQNISFFLLRKKLTKAFENAHYITSTSEGQQKVIKQIIPDHTKLLITRTGVDTGLFLDIYSKLTKQNDEIIIFSNRAMRPLYNIDIIVDAFNLLRKSTSIKQKLRLVLIDYCVDPEYSKYVRKKIADHNLQNEVTILPELSFEELIQAYKNADVVIMIPRSDGTPVTGVETLLSKKPLILGSLNYDSDLFNVNTSWKIKSAEPAELRDKIEEVLKESEANKKLKTENGFDQAVKNADVNGEISKIENLYDRMLSGLNSETASINRPVRTCVHCILDSNDDPEITFNEEGVCNYCIEFAETLKANNIGETQKLEEQLKLRLNEIKSARGNNKYDCIIGVSGGVDSTYLVYKATELGLHPLIVHYDNGWDSEMAVMNIENLVKKLNLDLVTYVSDWYEFKDIQLSFLKASVLDIELITDQAILAVLYKIAQEKKIKYILYGSNISTEGILPKNWFHWKLDVLNILAIHKLFGKVKIKSYPTLGFFRHLYVTKVLKIKSINLLNYVNYSKKEAKEIIIEKLNWKDYGGKHHESIFTRFYQSFILPNKFGIDKRKAHLSTLICSGQITREAALNEFKIPYDQEKTKNDYEYVLKKLELTPEEFEKLMRLPVVKHTHYPSYLTRHYKYQLWISKKLKPFTSLLKKLMS